MRESRVLFGGKYDERPKGTVVEVDDINLSFGGVKAIQGVSFSVGEGELFSIIGPNGAGKTSIFNCLSGVYKPQQGSIQWRGSQLLGQRPDAIARLGIARTFQNIELFEHMTVVDNLMTGRHIRMQRGWWNGMFYIGWTKREEIANRAVVEDIIDFLEIEEWRKYPVALLPYGIQKRVELGRALAMEPELLLLDEPVAGMNLEETEDMARFILDIRRELGIAMILVEHDMGLVMDIADRIMVLDFGKKIGEGTPDEVSANPDVIRAYLGEEFESAEAREAEAEVVTETHLLD
ncbi:MAG: ABC transporter ATP-binding protein [Acidimicrobiia bacterium]|nr:ABC transporter ATP-binding protein [Acidimicrobiia bacterium]